MKTNFVPMDNQINSNLYPEIQAHRELKRAVGCASGLFETNVKCLSQIVRMHREGDHQRTLMTERVLVINSNII